MSAGYRYTKHQVPRASKADAETHNAYFLFKNVSTLRLTYQIRLLTFRAVEAGRRLVIRVPANCNLHTSLRDFQKDHAKHIYIERV